MSMIIPNVEELISLEHCYRKLLLVVNLSALRNFKPNQVKYPNYSSLTEASRKGFGALSARGAQKTSLTLRFSTGP